MQTRHLIFALCITTGIISCKKDSSTASTSTTVTTDDAADAVTEAVTPESAGVVAQTQTATVVITTGSFDCGVESDTSYSGQNASGAAITYSYGFSFSRLLTCNNDIPQQFAFAYSGKTSYDAPRISSDDSAQAQFTITGLQPSASQYVFNETYTRKGSATSKVGNQLGFTSTILIQTTNLTVDKTSQQILSGTATVSISGATTSGKTFSYTGTLTFNGNKQATLVLGNSSTYNIVWS